LAEIALGKVTTAASLLFVTVTPPSLALSMLSLKEEGKELLALRECWLLPTLNN